MQPAISVHRWIQFDPGLDPVEVVNRLDFRELVIHIASIKSVALAPLEWHVVLAAGAGVRNMKADRHTDTQMTITCIMRDNPSLSLRFETSCLCGEEVFKIDKLIVRLDT